MSDPEMKKQRLEAAHRRRRIMLNTDAGAVHDGDPQHPERFLDRRITGLHETHVDVIAFCTDYAFNHYTQNSKVTQIVDYRGHPDDPSPDIIQGLIAMGTDTIEVATNYCHDHGMEIFWSMRMNDSHDSWIPPAVPQWKKDHPECLFGREADQPPHAPWTGVDYAQPAVQNQVLAILRDVCSRYDIDGIDLDYFKDLTCFKSMAWGHPVTDVERQAMTDMLGRVRRMTDEIGRARGRPILISARVPDSHAYARAIGLDVQQWMAQDLIDIHVATGYFRLQPWQQTIELGRRYQVPVYPVLEMQRVCEHRRADMSEPPKVRRLDESFRGDALNMWNAGAHGIYMFNFHYFHPTHQIWRQLGDPEILKSLNKMYFVSMMGKGHTSLDSFLPGGDRFIDIPMLCPDHPVELYPGQPLSTSIVVGDDLRSVQTGTRQPSVRLNVRLDPLARSSDLTIKLNGQSLAPAELTWTAERFRTVLAQTRKAMTGATELRVDDSDDMWRQWCEFELNAQTLVSGSNSIDIALGGDPSKPCVIMDIQIRVDFHGVS